MLLRRISRGFVFLTVAVALVAIVGMLGLCLDLGRLHIARSELQTWADAAATAAAYALDGDAAGIRQAAAQALSHPKSWSWETREGVEVRVLFATSADGEYHGEARAPAGASYVRVEAEASVPLYFVPAFGAARQQTLEATATAGQVAVRELREHLAPYSPEAIDTADSNYGFQQGGIYTLRWPPPGGREDPERWCPGDRQAGYASRSPWPQRGLIDLAVPRRGRPAAFLRQAILSDEQAHPVAAGDRIFPGQGDWDAEAAALQERVAQDTDAASITYQEYTESRRGNGRRLVVAPVNDPASDQVAGFAGFFLPASPCGPDDQAPCCAEYVGAALLPGRKAAGPPGAYRVQLVR